MPPIPCVRHYLAGIKALIAMGADPARPDGRGQGAQVVARQAENPGLADWLEAQ